ncbi:MAG: DUF5996 family protein [Candidatus Saccharimonadales bacterium]
MNNDYSLPELDIQAIKPTIETIRDVSLILSSLQRAYIPKHPKQWQYGLNVSLRGLVTEPLKINGDMLNASLDFVTQKVRLGNSSWRLDEYSPPEIEKNILSWLQNNNQKKELEKEELKGGAYVFNKKHAKDYAQSLWWIQSQIKIHAEELTGGYKAPILLYPHHFDLSFVWFPFDDDRQIALGYSTGDENIASPYLYLTAYPEPEGIKSVNLPDGVKLQAEGFSGIILPYEKLRSSNDPTFLFEGYFKLMNSVRLLFD